MSIRKLSIMLFSAVTLAALISGCGGSSKEGGTPASTVDTPGGVARSAESGCRVCHASTPDPATSLSIVVEHNKPTSIHNLLADGTLNAEAGCQGCHGGGAQHNGVGPIPFPNPLAANRCNAAECHNGTIPATLTGANFVASCAAANCHTNSTSIHSITFAVPTGFTAKTPPGTNLPDIDRFLPANPAAATAAELQGNCVMCHAIDQAQHLNGVNDNNGGVRAITGEFQKWSHHVTGVDVNNAHCAACHLEGKVSTDGSKIQVDITKHMTDAKTHLRHSDTDADLQWDPAAPNHSTMDTFCMSCHDANGAISPMSVKIQAFINAKGINAPGKTASAKNPFGDTISNRYDKMLRPAVVNVSSQFDTTNNSHHGVKGPRYSGRTRAAGPRQIANPAAFAANSSATLYGTRSTIYDSVNAFTKLSEFATNPAFNALYVPLENAGGETAPRTGAASLGDDSTLHCGDCHTVGQFKPNATVNAAGATVATVIGAHGSNNEYLLRNDKGTDERHTQEAYTKAATGEITYVAPDAANLVCFNCHSFKRYGSVYNATGATGPHAGEYDASGRCNGVGNTIPFNGYTTGTATDGTQFLSRIGELTLAQGSSTPAFAPGFPLNYANAPGGVQAATYTGEQNADFGNIFGIQCLNCHNSGVGNGYGGIHGSANNSPGTANTAAAGGYANPDPSVRGGAYVDGMGNTTKVQRFLPGLGNVMHVPGTLGGFTGGKTAQTFYAGNNYNFTTGAISKDANWEQIGWKQIAGNPTGGVYSGGAGCYTLNDEGTGSSLDDPNSAAYGLKGQSFDGGATIPKAAKTWGGCDDHTGTSVGGADHGFYKRINRPVTY